MEVNNIAFQLALVLFPSVPLVFTLGFAHVNAGLIRYHVRPHFVAVDLVGSVLGVVTHGTGPRSFVPWQ